MAEAVIERKDELQARVARILELAGQAGADQAEASMSVGRGLSVSVRMGALESLEHHQGRGLGLSVYINGCKGSASTSDLSDQALTDTVAAACAIARHTEQDKAAGLAEVESLATEIPDLDLYHPWELSAEQAEALALRCEEAARSHDARIVNSDGASVNRYESLRVYGNTHGFLHGYAATRASLGCSVVAAQDDERQPGHWSFSCRHPEELEDAEVLGKTAAQRAVDKLGSQSVLTGQYPVLFAAEVARGLLSHYVGAVSGAAQYRRASFLLDAEGEQVFPGWVRIHEQPHLLRGMGSAPFDHEGVAPQTRDLVSNGVCAGYVLNSYAARRLQRQSTGNAGGVHNLSIDSGDDNLAALLKRMDTGFLATSLMGQGVNGVSGDYSRGAAGFWVQGGEIRHPVQEITVAGNLKTMFLGLQAVGNDVDRRGNIHSGSLLIDEMTVAGRAA